MKQYVVSLQFHVQMIVMVSTIS